jgi:hypothetical protein
MSFDYDPIKSAFFLKIKVPLSDNLPCTNAVTIQSILESNNVDIELHAILQFSENLYLTQSPLYPLFQGGYFPISAIKGQFNGNDHGSCDPYYTNMTLLIPEVKVKGIDEFSNPWQNSNAKDQGELLYYLSLGIQGGIPDDDDFPNEFRPVLIFPASFDVKYKSDDFILGDAYYSPSCSTKLDKVISGIDPNIATFSIPSNCLTKDRAIDKSKNIAAALTISMIRVCSNNNNISNALDFVSSDILTNNQLSISKAQCATNISPSTIDYINTDDTYSINITPSTIGANPIARPSVPIAIDINYSASLIKQNGSYADSLENGFIYFKNCNTQNQQLTVKLTDINGQELAADKFTVGFGSHSQIVYKIGKIPISSSPVLKVYMTLYWTKCTVNGAGNGYQDLSFDIVVGNVNKGYSALTNINDLTSCNHTVQTYSFVPEFASIDANLILPIGVNGPTTTGCSPVTQSFQVFSLGSTIATCYVDVNLPQGTDLDFSLTKVNSTSLNSVPSFGVINTSSPSSKSYRIYLTSFLGPNLFFRSSPNIPIVIDLAIKFDGTFYLTTTNPTTLPVQLLLKGSASCGELITPKNLDFNINYSAPPTPLNTVTITGPNNICESAGGSVQLNALPNDPNLLTYLWSSNLGPSQGATINVIEPGIYNLIVTDNNGCSLTLNHDVYNEISVSINSPTGTTFCIGQALPPVVLNANVSSLTPVTYLWSNGETTSSITINNPTATATYTVTVTNANCSATDEITININPDCCSTFSAELTQADFNGPKTIAAGTYNLNSDVVVSDIITVLPGVEIAIAPNVKIRIQNQGQLNILNGIHLFACGNEMWDGIVAEPGSAIRLHKNANDNTIGLIEHAKIAIDAYTDINTPTTLVDIQDQFTFNENNIGVYLHEGDFSNLILRGVTFKCNNVLKSPFNTNGLNKYSNVHLLCEDAGAINLTGNNTSNINCTFIDAYIGIKLIRTSLDINNCVFVKHDYIGRSNFGIFANGFVVNNPAQNYFSLNVGSMGVPNNYNNFDSVDCGISASNGYNCKIVSNRFLDGKIGIKLFNCTYRSIDIHNNEMIHCLNRGIQIQNNSYADISITENKINVSSNIDNTIANESAKGIYVNNTYEVQNKNFDISENQIANCRTGIHVMNQAHGNIDENTVSFNTIDGFIIDPVGYRRKGYWLNNCRDIDLKSNGAMRFCAGCTLTTAMANSGATVDYMIGYSLDMSDVQMSDNEAQGLPVACRVSDKIYTPPNPNPNPSPLFILNPVPTPPGSTTQLHCNTFSDCLLGFKLVDVNLPQQGDQYNPSGNQFTNWTSTLAESKINGPIPNSPNPIPWYYNPFPSDYNIDQDYNAFIIAGLNTISGDNCAPTCFICQRLRNIYEMSNDSNYYYLEEENAYQRRRLAYELLKDSIQIMYSGSEYDADLQNFFTATTLSSIGALSNVTDLLNNNNYATAYLINENFESTNLRELNSTFLNEICAQYYEDTIAYNENQRQQLFTIAYQYPGIGGEAVYRARAILNLDLDDTQLNYRLGKEEYKSTTINVYPNPSTGNFQFQYVLSEDEIATIEVYDMLGKIVYTKSLTATNSTHSITLKNCDNGLYNLRLTSSNGSVYSNLLNLIK